MKNRPSTLAQHAFNSVRHLWNRRRRELDRRGRRQAFLLESLEARHLMAADLGAWPQSGNDGPDIQSLYASHLAGYDNNHQFLTSSQAAADQAEGESAEGEAQPDLVAFAKALTAAGVKFYGAAWCPHCTATKELFGDGAQYLPFIEVTNNDATRSLNSVGQANNITTYPTWVFPTNSTTAPNGRLEGQRTLAEISAAAGIAIPSGSNPSLAPIGNQTVLGGAPLWVGLDGADANSNSLTYSIVSNSNPSLLTTNIPTGNRSLVIEVEGFGKMKFELFDHLAPRVTDAIAALVNAGEYNKTASRSVTFHRVIEDFMIQAGQYSPAPGTFQDQFHPDAQHTGKGLLSLAKTSADDSGTSQFFITDDAERHLDFNHPVFGRLIEGDAVRDAINAVHTNSGDVPTIPVVIKSMSIENNDTENGLLMLKAAHGASGSATVTVRATDAEGLFVDETFTVTVAADTQNTPPFLSDIPLVRTNSGQQVQFQLQGNDVEGNTLEYVATNPSPTTQNYQLLVNSATGLVTVTPAAGFVGKLTVLVQVKEQGVTNSALIDGQLVTINVAPLPPTLVNLKDNFDTGSSNSDNVTNAQSMEFEVTGVTANAIIKLYRGDTMIAQQTASGTSTTFSTSVVSAAGQGAHAIRATQTIGDVESDKSSALNVTFDSTPPDAFTSVPPSQATVGQPFVYNASNPEENTAGFRYEIAAGAAANISINAATGAIAWSPTPAQVGNQSFTINAIDAAGNVRAQTVTATVSAAVDSKVRIILKVTDAQGNELTSLTSNQEFFLRAFVHDRRVDKYGVFAAFTDVTYDASKATVIGPIDYGSFYTLAQSGTTTAPGLLDEVGGGGGSQEPANPFAQVELFAVPMRATASGGLTFTANPADVLPSHHVLLYRQNTAVPSTEVEYGTTSVTVDLSFGAIADSFTANEDVNNFELNPLANDTVGSNTLTITGTGTTSNGGTVTVSQDGKKLLYSPADNFVGTETFTYTIKNQDDTTDTATITVQVLNVNDNPTAVADAVSVSEDSSNTIIDVLANDLIAPDTGETLKVLSVGAGSSGGTLSVGTGGANVVYTPGANFVGTETFTYQVSDGNNGTATGTVTVTVTAGNDNPTAAADSFTVAEDTTSTQFNPLANDSSTPDIGETLTIVSTGATNKGGTVTISEDKTKLIYTPAANFQGVEKFTYTISDGNGGTATAEVTMTVTNANNDAPTATADALNAFKNTKATFDVLANDSSAPDPTETLTISAVGTPSNGGTVAIVNGKIEYTPASSYTGTETFTYTIRDAGGLTSTATATVTVAEFIPSDLSGFVYIDGNGNGVRDVGEMPLSGVTVTLTGNNQGGAVVNRTAVTGSDGKYLFDGLAPGSYRVKETTPAFMMDGGEAVGSHGGTVSANDEFTIQLAQDTNAENYNFGEQGRTSATLSIRDLFASRSHNYLMVAVNTTTGAQWTLAKGNWQGFTNAKATITTANNVSSLKLEVTNPQSQVQQATIALPDGRIDELATNGNMRLYKVVGTPASFGFTGGSTAANTSSFASQSIEGAEGESLAASLAANDAALAEGESWHAASDPLDLDDNAGEEDAIDQLLATQSNW